MGDMTYNKSSKEKDKYNNINESTDSNLSSDCFGITHPDTIFLILILVCVVVYYEKVDSLSNSTIIILFLVLFIGKNLIRTYVKYNSDLEEGLSIISNEALQDLGSALSNGTMTVNKQYCVSNGSTTRCLTFDFFNRSGVAPLP